MFQDVVSNPLDCREICNFPGNYSSSQIPSKRILRPYKQETPSSPANETESHLRYFWVEKELVGAGRLPVKPHLSLASANANSNANEAQLLF